MGSKNDGAQRSMQAEQEPANTVSNIVRRAFISIDRETPPEVQLAELAATGQIYAHWRNNLTSENYHRDTSRPSTITLGECHFDRSFRHTDLVKEAVQNEKGVIRNGDPYEFCAWLRHNPQAGLDYPIAVLNHSLLENGRRKYAFCAAESNGQRSVRGVMSFMVWSGKWRFLVVCEELPPVL